MPKQVALGRIFSALSSLLASTSESSPRDERLRRSSTITLKKSSCSGSTLTIPRSFVTSLDLSALGLHRAKCVETAAQITILARYSADDAPYHNDAQRFGNAWRMGNRTPIQLSLAAN